MSIHIAINGLKNVGIFITKKQAAWARWLAVDSDGDIWIYDGAPSQWAYADDPACGSWTACEGAEHCENLGVVDFSYLLNGFDWRETLTRIKAA